MQNALISFTLLLLIGCGGEEFTGYEQDVDTSALGGGAGETTEDRGGASQGGSAGIAGLAGSSSPPGGSSGSTAGQGSGGATAVAGGPAMGEGGSAGCGQSESCGDPSPSECLADHQNLECARVCNSQPSCQGILDCFVRTNSTLTSDCPGYSDTGYSLALQAERNCCHD